MDYIWYTHPTKLIRRNTGLCPAYIGLRHRSYSRWTEEQAALDIRGWEISLKEVYFGTHDYKYKWDYIQFLQNVTGGYQEVFKRLLNLARDYKLGNERMLIVSTDKVDNLPQDLKDQFEIIRVDAERQDKTVDIPEAKTKSEDSNKKNKTLFFDDNTNYLWFSKDKKTRIEGEDAKLVKAMLDMAEKENRHCCRKEEIILKAYKITVGINQKIPQKITTKLNTSKSTINKKCELDLNIKELIQRDGVKLLKYSINVERRKL